MAPTQRRSTTSCWLLYHFIWGERLITSRGTQVNDHYISPGMWPTRALAWGANITPKIRSVIKHPPRVTLRACSGASRCSGAAQNVYCIIVWEKITYNKTFSFRWIMPFDTSSVRGCGHVCTHSCRVSTSSTASNSCMSAAVPIATAVELNLVLSRKL